MIIVIYTADKALKAFLAERIGIIIKAFAAIVADQFCAVSAVVLLTGRKGMVGTFVSGFHTRPAYFTVTAAISDT
jgi:hypothetical protein